MLDSLRRSLEDKRTITLAAAILACVAGDCAYGAEASAPPAAASPTGWSVTRTADTGPVMTRTVAPATFDLRVVTDEYNMFTPTLELKVAECGGHDWTLAESATPVGASVTDRAARMREMAARQLGKAREACSFPADIDAVLLNGMEEAYAAFEAIRQ